MPVSFLNEAERDRLNRFPWQISDKDLVMFFALSASGDSVGIRVKRMGSLCCEFNYYAEYIVMRR